MKAIDNAAISSWLNTNQLVSADGSLELLGAPLRRSYPIPSDSAKKTVLSRIVASLFDSDREALLWINEYGIWPSAEDWTLFSGFRAHLGEESSLHEKPGYLFSNKDVDLVSSILALVLYFVWGALLISPDKRFLVRISHDEVLETFCSDPQALPSRVIQQLESVTRINNE